MQIILKQRAHQIWRQEVETSLCSEVTSQSSLADVMASLKGIEGRLCNADKRLDALEVVKRKVDTFDNEKKKLWVALEYRYNKVAARVTVIEDKVESSDFAVSMLNDKVLTLEKEREMLREEMTYLHAQSMMNNLLFSNIPEAQPGVIEVKIREFLVEQMKIAKEAVDRIVLERVHRIGHKQQGIGRKIVAKFLEFKDKEYVRKQWKSLESTPFYVSEQFLRDVI